jgi:hypothetical protein
MAVAKKKPAETEGAKVSAAADTMPDILLYLEKKDQFMAFTPYVLTTCPTRRGCRAAAKTLLLEARALVCARAVA